MMKIISRFDQNWNELGMIIIDFEPNTAFAVGPPTFFGLEISYDYKYTPHEYVYLTLSEIY